MNDFVAFLEKNWQVVEQAPWVFVTFLVLAAGVSWALLKMRTELLQDKVASLEHQLKEKSQALENERKLASKYLRWDSRYASVQGLLIVHLMHAASTKQVSINLQEICEQLGTVDYDYAYGFVVALAAARLIEYSSDFETSWDFHYVDRSLTQNLDSDFEQRLEQVLKEEREQGHELAVGNLSIFRADRRRITDYVEVTKGEMIANKEARNKGAQDSHDVRDQ